MANAQLGAVLRQVRGLFSPPAAADRTDAQLLEQYLAAHDEAAFAELVRRLGPMVLGVCRRVLGSDPEVEDVFQAAFLMLAAKGSSIRRREAVAGWLYEVTHHLALKTKANAARRSSHERLAAEMLRTHSVPDRDWQELRAVLDEELQRLPEKYRTPLILCYLEGKTNEQAARELGWPVGSMSRHLARARELLRERLTHQGVLLSVGLLGTLLAENAAAAVPARLLTSTVKAATLFAATHTVAAGVVSTPAATLARGMIQAMFLSRLKLAVVLTLALGVLSVGGGVLLHQALTAPAAAAAPDEALLFDAAPGQPAAQPAPGKDAHGDPLPPGALFRLGTIRFRHAGPISFVAFPPDGKTVLTAAQDGTIRLWDLDNGHEIRRYSKAQAAAPVPAPNAVPGGRAQMMLPRSNLLNTSNLALSPDGKTLAVSVNYNTIQLFEVGTGKELRELKAPQGATLLTFSPDSKLLAGKAGDRSVVLWEAASGQVVRQIKAPVPNQPRGGVIAIGNFYGASPTLVFSPDGKVLAIDDTHFDNQKMSAGVKLLDVETGKDLRQIKIEQNGLSGVAFSPDGKVLAYGSGDTIHLCQADSGKEIGKIGGQDSGIGALLYSPDGKTLVTRGARDAVIRLNDVATGKIVRQLGGIAAAAGANVVVLRGFGGMTNRDVAFSPDGKLLASGNGSNALRIWETASGKELAQSSGHRGPVAVLVIARDGKTIVSKGADNTIRRWDTVTGKETSHFEAPAGTTVVAFAPDGQAVAMANTDNSIRVHAVADGKELHRLKGHANGTASLAFTPDSKTLASRGVADNSIRLHDVTKGSELKQITVQTDSVPANPGGAVVMVWGGFGGASTGLVFSPDGKTVASGIGGTVRAVNGGAMMPRNEIGLWDVATGKVVRKIPLPQQRGVVSMAFAPDGRVLATENNDSTITLWEVASGKERGTLGKAGGPVGGQPGMMQPQVMLVGAFTGAANQAASTLAFAADGRTLVTRGADQSLRIWDVANGKELRQFKGHQGPVTAVAYAPNGKTVASGSGDTTILVWDVSNLSLPSKPPVVELSAKDVDGLWTDLASEDGAKAFQSIQKLTASPKQAVALVQERIKPAAGIDPKQLEQWIADLESDKFTVRKQALEQLEKQGALAVPALRKVLAGQPPLETRKRAEELLEKLTGGNLTTDQVRVVRAVEVLEQVGTSEARQVLATLAKGAAGALSTNEAQTALERLAKLSTARP